MTKKNNPSKSGAESSLESQLLENLKNLSRGDIAVLKRAAGGTIAEGKNVMGLFYRILPHPLVGDINEEIYFLVSTLYALWVVPKDLKQSSGSSTDDSDAEINVDNEEEDLENTEDGVRQKGFRQRNFGWTMRLIKRSFEETSKNTDGLDRRFEILLDGTFERVEGGKPGGGSLAYRLRQCVKLARNHEKPIDWIQLMKDLKWWSHDNRTSQKNWARAYFGYHGPTNPESKEDA